MPAPQQIGTDAIIGVIGAGAMGAGIAQVAAVAGHRVLLTDMRHDAATRGVSGVQQALQRLADKGKMSSEAAAAAAGRIEVVSIDGRDYSAFAACDFVIEAIVEDLGVKRELFKALESAVSDQCVLATNTSSLSVTSIGRSVCTSSTRRR
jgi:3-hydroxybutyryl-CoA dehydrogenase